ncbi:hypothetical protein DFH09DRAFT_1019623 [Mycena vulgaris]|nr:hypothetical protein DFH09DRAFT_1019623 [Mycena vulgaris]
MARALPPHWTGTELMQNISKLNQAKFDTTAGARKPSPRLGRKGFLYLQKSMPAVKPAESARITARRVLKAERDERMDVTHALTPVKQYMSGFTRPSDLRSTNWFPGGSYLARQKVYESPAPEAYEPHTVFVLESRYNIRYGVGRVDAPDYIYGMCREQDLPTILKGYNSAAAGRDLLEAMDNARWPWGPQLPQHRMARWWVDREDLKETLKELGSDIVPTSAYMARYSGKEDGDDVDPVKVKPAETSKSPKKKPPRVTSLNSLPPRSTTPPLPPGDTAFSSLPASARSFSSSSTLFVGHSYNDDHIVPDFYVQRKQAKANKEEEDGELKASEKPVLQDTSSLMDHLSDGIMSDEIVASTRRLASKIPTELFNADGVLVHPSGFVIPTPAHAPSSERAQRQKDLAQQTAAVAERVLEEDFTEVTAETSSRRGKVPFEVRRPDGTVSHPSGFEPPTAADDFEHSGNSTVDSHIGQQPLVLPSAKRGLHTTAIARAEEAEWDFARARAAQPGLTFVPRDEYLRTLDEMPFWRPLVTLTVSTRPIGATLLRLSKGLATGRPYHSDISNDDKKCRISFVHRMRALRVKRMQDNAVEMGKVLAGMRGGVIGLRFDTESMGRGIGGEGLERPVPWEKRVIRVGVGEWYRLAADVKELFQWRGKDEILSSDGCEPFEVFGLDDFGRKLDANGAVVPWPTRRELTSDALRREPWFKEYSALKTTSWFFQAHARATGTASEERKAHAQRNATDSGDEGEDELALDEEEEVQSGMSAQAPTVLIRPASFGDIKQRLAEGMLDLDSHHAELDAPPDFVVTRPDGTRVIGPENETAAKEMTQELTLLFARRVVQRRLDLYYITKHRELGAIFAARSNQVIYPDKFKMRQKARETEAEI